MRPAIIKLHEKGYSTREIEQLLDVSTTSERSNRTALQPTKRARLKTSFVTTAPMSSRSTSTGAMPTANGRPTAPISTRLHNMEHLDGERMPEAPSERGIFETSLEESVERNHLGRSGQDRRQLPQASPGLH